MTHESKRNTTELSVAFRWKCGMTTLKMDSGDLLSYKDKVCIVALFWLLTAQRCSVQGLCRNNQITINSINYKYRPVHFGSEQRSEDLWRDWINRDKTICFLCPGYRCPHHISNRLLCRWVNAVRSQQLTRSQYLQFVWSFAVGWAVRLQFFPVRKSPFSCVCLFLVCVLIISYSRCFLEVRTMRKLGLLKLFISTVNSGTRRGCHVCPPSTYSSTPAHSWKETYPLSCCSLSTFLLPLG